MKNRILLPFLLILITFVSFSCISVERKISLNIDGSGSEKMKMNIGKSFFDMIISFGSIFDSTGQKAKSIRDSIYDDKLFSADILKNLNNAEGIHLNELKTFTEEDSSKTIFVDYAFDSVKYLSGVMNGISDDKKKKSGAIVTFENLGDRILFRYKIEPQKNEGEEGSSIDLKSFGALFAGKKMTFEILFPSEIISSNSLRQDNKTLYWEFDTEKIYADNESVVLEAVFKK